MVAASGGRELGRYIGNSLRQCRNKRAIETQFSLMCKTHAHGSGHTKKVNKLLIIPKMKKSPLTTRKPICCPICGKSPQFHFLPPKTSKPYFQWVARCHCKEIKKVYTGESQENAKKLWKHSVLHTTTIRIIEGLPLYPGFRKFVWLNSPVNQNYLFQFKFKPKFIEWLLENLNKLNEKTQQRMLQKISEQI